MKEYDKARAAVAERLKFDPREMKWSQCVYCTRKHTTGATCDAFPGGIPNEILHNDVSHRLPFPGDGGLVFDQYEAPAE